MYGKTNNYTKCVCSICINLSQCMMLLGMKSCKLFLRIIQRVERRVGARKSMAEDLVFSRPENGVRPAHSKPCFSVLGRHLRGVILQTKINYIMHLKLYHCFIQMLDIISIDWLHFHIYYFWLN